jgi:murein L,D-transpeptidase YafK
LIKLPETVESAVVVDLESNRAYIYRQTAEGTLRRQDLYVSIGKNGTEKAREGDERTPVGIYFSTTYLPGTGLPAIYGVGALPLDYPNLWDLAAGRTGSGIWIHGTDKEGDDLLPQSSRGCLAFHNEDFQVVADAVEIARSPVILAKSLRWVVAAEIEAERKSFLAALEAWRLAWESRDTDRYLQFYSQSFSTSGMSRQRFAAHKRRVNGYKTRIEVELRDIGAYGYPGEAALVLATFVQDYRSNNFNQRREKLQFWRREQGGWRIVLEGSR